MIVGIIKTLMAKVAQKNNHYKDNKNRSSPHSNNQILWLKFNCDVKLKIIRENCNKGIFYWYWHINTEIQIFLIKNEQLKWIKKLNIRKP